MTNAIGDSHVEYMPPTPTETLLSDINNQINKIKKDGGYNEQKSEWKSTDDRYSQKLNVLNKMVEYVKDKNKLSELSTIVKENPGYNKSLGTAVTEKLLQRALKLHQQTLQQDGPAPKRPGFR